MRISNLTADELFLTAELVLEPQRHVFYDDTVTNFFDGSAAVDIIPLIFTGNGGAVGYSAYDRREDQDYDVIAPDTVLAILNYMNVNGGYSVSANGSSWAVDLGTITPVKAAIPALGAGDATGDVPTPDQISVTDAFYTAHTEIREAVNQLYEASKVDVYTNATFPDWTDEPEPIPDIVLFGHGVPDNGLGSEMQFYVDLDAGHLYQKQSGSYVVVSTTIQIS